MNRINIVLFIILSSLIAHAQMNVSFISTSNSGIPSNLVASLLIDSKDQLWVGTNDKGIGVFDGNSWKYYNTNNTSALQSDYINDIKEHPNGDMWFGTGLGIAVLSNGNWTFYDTTIIKYYSLSYAKYQLYVQFDSKGDAYTISYDMSNQISEIYKFDNSSWSIFHSDTSNTFVNIGFPRDFVIDQTDKIWVKNGYFLDGTKWNKVPNPNKIYDFYDGCIAVDLSNNIWFSGTNLKFTKISVPLRWDGTVTTNFDTVKSYNSITWNQIIRVNPFNGNVWYANIDWTVSGFTYPKRGLAEWYDGNSWNFDTSLNSILDSATNLGPLNMSVKAITFDKKGNVWLGLNNEGEYSKQYPDSGGIILFNQNGIDLTNFPVGIDKEEERITQHLKLYPNPSSDHLTISGNTSVIENLTVIDFNGSIVKWGIDDNQTIDIRELPAGLYLIRVITKTEVLTGRFVKE